MAQSDEKDMLTVKDVAEQFHVSTRTVERWIERGLPAQKANQAQVVQLLMEKRIKGIPPKGIWVIPRVSLANVETIRKSVGFPLGKKRKMRV